MHSRTEGIGAYKKADKDYSTIFSKNVTFSIPDLFLFYDYNGLSPLNLNVHDIPIGEDDLTEQLGVLPVIHNSAYAKYLKENNTVQSDNSEFGFIESVKIDYLIFTKNAVKPDYVNEKFKLLAKDRISGNEFYVRK